MRKTILISLLIMLIFNVSAFCQRISDIPAPEKKTINMAGWSFTYDDDKDWVIWGSKSPILEKREIRSDVNEDGIPYTYHWGSFYLCDNSIIITINYDKYFYQSQRVYFLYDYGWDSKKGENCYRKIKDAIFSRYGYANCAYNNDENLVNWVKEELKNKTSQTPPIQVLVRENNGFGYYYPMITYDLYPFSDKEITNSKKALFSRPEDKGVTETERLDAYPTPTNSNKTINDYIDWKLSNAKGYYCPHEQVSANVEFVIETDGTVSNLIIDRGECYVTRRNYQQCLDINNELKGFNSWVAGIINSTTFNPGKLDGNPVRTHCKFMINYKNNNIRKFRDVSIVYNGEKYGITGDGRSMKYDYIFDEVIIMDDTDLEVIIDGKHGVLRDVYKKETSQRNFLIPIQYDSIAKINKTERYNVFRGFWAIKDGRKTIFDESGKELFSLDHSFDVTLFDVGYEMWETQNAFSKKYGIISKTGKEILPCEFEQISFYNPYGSDEFFAVKKDGKFGIIILDASRDLDEIEIGKKANQIIQMPKMWFDEIDLVHSYSIYGGGRNSYYDNTFWVKMDGNENWELVRVNKSGSVDVLLKPEFDSVSFYFDSAIYYYEASKGNKTYRISIDEKGRASKKRIKK